MIQSFANKHIESFHFEGKLPRGAGLASVRKSARRKLAALDSAHTLLDLKSPPGNKLEALKGELAGFHSIRVNEQWRIIFKWPANSSGPMNVNVVDYH